MELICWCKIGIYMKKKEKIDTLDFLYKQCKRHH